MSENNYEKEIVDRVEKLPPMPESIMKLRQLYNDPNSSLLQVTDIVKSDPGFVANILHLANSAYYGVNHQVDSIDEAVRYIGFEPLINFLSTKFSSKVIHEHFNTLPCLNDYFTHSKEVSLAALILAKEAGKSRKEQSLLETAGLLHDIGRLVIMVVCKNENELLSDDWHADEKIAEKEKEILGINHCDVGKDISNKWAFSSDMIQIIEKHHTPFEGEYCENAAFIMVAHFISMDEVDDNLLINLYPKENLDMMKLTPTNLINAKHKFNELKAQIV